VQVRDEVVHDLIGSRDGLVKLVMRRKAAYLHAAPQAVKVGRRRPERRTDKLYLPLLESVAVRAISTDRPRLGTPS
jgi:hypothetical protein